MVLIELFGNRTQLNAVEQVSLISLMIKYNQTKKNWMSELRLISVFKLIEFNQTQINTL